MRHDLVTRAAIGLTALLVAAALLFAWSVRVDPALEHASAREGGSAAGERAFHAHCARCHEVDEIVSDMGRHADFDEASRSLLELLSGHGDAGASDDRAIVDHLRALAERRSRRASGERRRPRSPRSR